MERKYLIINAFYMLATISSCGAMDIPDTQDPPSILGVAQDFNEKMRQYGVSQQENARLKEQIESLERQLTELGEKSKKEEEADLARSIHFGKVSKDNEILRESNEYLRYELRQLGVESKGRLKELIKLRQKNAALKKKNLDQLKITQKDES